MTDHIYGEESIKIKQTAKTDWVRSEFREQEKYRRNYYGTIFLEILLEKMQRKEDVLYIESVRAPRVVRVKRRKKEPDPKNCNVMEKQNEPVAKTCDEHRSKEPAASGGRSVQSVQNVQDMPVMPEIRLSNEPAERLQKGRSGLGINVEMPPESRNVGNSQGGNQYSMEHSMRSSMEVFKEYSMNVSKTGMASISGETILVWASGDILELSVMSELPEISGNYNAWCNVAGHTTGVYSSVKKRRCSSRTLSFFKNRTSFLCRLHKKFQISCIRRMTYAKINQSIFLPCEQRYSDSYICFT